MSLTSSVQYPRGVLTISDIHLGHSKTPTSHILANLKAFLGDFKLRGNFDQLKLILIAGDLWDKSIPLSHPAVSEFVVFWYGFLHWATQKKIAVRLMKGTPGHDEEQGKAAAAYAASMFPEADFRYVDDIEIEIHEKLGLSILYVPDEARPSAKHIYKDVCACLREKQLTQVDIGCMHGMFEFQLGDIPMSHRVHDSTLYSQLVKNWITIGHIHTGSRLGKIYAQGSFDRLAHGEEGPKGAFYMTESSPGNWDALFLENKNALRYESYRASRKDTTTIHHVEKWLTSFKPGEHARIVVQATHPLVNAISELCKRFPSIHITRKIEKEKPIKKKQEKQEAITVTLNKQTLVTAILEEVAATSPMPEQDMKQLSKLLSSLET